MKKIIFIFLMVSIILIPRELKVQVLSEIPDALYYDDISPRIPINTDHLVQGGFIYLNNQSTSSYKAEFIDDSVRNYQVLPGPNFIGIKRFSPSRVYLSLYTNDSMCFMDSSFTISKLISKVSKIPKTNSKSYYFDKMKSKRIYDQMQLKDTFQFTFNGKFIYPLDQIFITDSFGTVRKSWNYVSYHHGIDLRARKPKPLKAISDGYVVAVFETPLFGKTVLVNHGSGIQVLYMHLSKVYINEGDYVTCGKMFASTGNTGKYTSAPHLHLTLLIHKIPVNFVEFYEMFKVKKSKTYKYNRYKKPKLARAFFCARIMLNWRYEWEKIYCNNFWREVV